MSEDIPIRITSVFTLADDGQKNLNSKTRENLNSKTEGNNPQSWQNEQWSTVCSLEDERVSNHVYMSSKELIKLAAKHEESVGLPSVTILETTNDTKSLFSNTSSRRQPDNQALSSDNTDATSNIYTVFRVATDACPSFCCQYNPVLIATLRAKALNMAEIEPKATSRSDVSAAQSSGI